MRETHRENPPYNIRGLYFTAISGLGRFGGGGVLASDFDHQNHVVHLGLGRASWQGAQGHCPTTSTASLPVLARRFRADLREVGLFEGLGLDSWKLGPASTRASVGREPVTAEDCGSGVSNWARTPTGFESTRRSTTSLLASSCSSSPNGIGRHVVTESGPRPSTWPAAWPWSSVVSCPYRPFG